MQENNNERPAGLIISLRTILAIWFFAGMPLCVGLSGLYVVAGIPLPPRLNVLASLVYLSGSLLGILWSRDNLRRQKIAHAELIGTLLMLSASIGFLSLGIIFAIRAFKSL